LICRLLAFFDTAFFDAVEREKERYDKDAIEPRRRALRETPVIPCSRAGLVAEENGTIIGLIDLECESDGLSR